MAFRKRIIEPIHKLFENQLRRYKKKDGCVERKGNKNDVRNRKESDHNSTYAFMEGGTMVVSTEDWDKRSSDTKAEIGKTMSDDECIRSDMIDETRMKHISKSSKRPILGTLFEQNLNECLQLKYSPDARGFVREHSDGNIEHGNLWCLVQTEAIHMEPTLLFDDIGFRFDNEHFAKDIDVLKEKAKLLNEPQQEYVSVKIDSLIAMKHICDGNRLKGHKLLRYLQSRVDGLEMCDLVGWFHLAKFWSLLNAFRDMEYLGTIKQYYIFECLHHLEKARECFLKDWLCFKYEAALVLWWKFLVSMDITNINPARSLPTMIYSVPYTLKPSLSTFKREIEHLQEFQEANTFTLLAQHFTNGITSYVTPEKHEGECIFFIYLFL